MTHHKPVLESCFEVTRDGHRKFCVTKTNKGENVISRNVVTRTRKPFKLVKQYARSGSDACKESVDPCLVPYKIDYCTASKIAKYYWKSTHIVSDVEYQTESTSTPTKFALNDSKKLL